MSRDRGNGIDWFWKIVLFYRYLSKKVKFPNLGIKWYILVRLVVPIIPLPSTSRRLHRIQPVQPEKRTRPSSHFKSMVCYTKNLDPNFQLPSLLIRHFYNARLRVGCGTTIYLVRCILSTFGSGSFEISIFVSEVLFDCGFFLEAEFVLSWIPGWVSF
jgi:hypothetical protein